MKNERVTISILASTAKLIKNTVIPQENSRWEDIIQELIRGYQKGNQKGNPVHDLHDKDITGSNEGSSCEGSKGDTANDSMTQDRVEKIVQDLLDSHSRPSKGDLQEDNQMISKLEKRVDALEQWRMSVEEY